MCGCMSYRQKQNRNRTGKNHHQMNIVPRSEGANQVPRSDMQRSQGNSRGNSKQLHAKTSPPSVLSLLTQTHKIRRTCCAYWVPQRHLQHLLGGTAVHVNASDTYKYLFVTSTVPLYLEPGRTPTTWGHSGACKCLAYVHVPVCHVHGPLVLGAEENSDYPLPRVLRYPVVVVHG